MPRKSKKNKKTYQLELSEEEFQYLHQLMRLRILKFQREFGPNESLTKMVTGISQRLEALKDGFSEESQQAITGSNLPTVRRRKSTRMLDADDPKPRKKRTVSRTKKRYK